MPTLSNAIRWLVKDARGSSWICKLKISALACSVYQIWVAKNRLVFDSVQITVEGLVCRIKTLVYKVMFTLYTQVLVHFEPLAMDC